jgi:hypothetical protein
MAVQRASTVRVLALRSSALSLAKTCSIGLRSGLSGGRESSRAPLAFDRLLDALHLVGAEVVEDHDVTAGQLRRQGLLDVGEEAFTVDRTVERTRGGIRSWRSAARKVVFQWPCGTAATRRMPFELRP